jgi:glycosyltransferase involved in cell wall biosynthesis
MKVVVNAVSAKLGGAATYVQNLARSLTQQAQSDDAFLFFVPPERASEIPGNDPRMRVATSRAATGSYARRWWWDQVTLRRIVARERPDVLFSSANFAMLACPCPQALLVRIPIYFSRDYLEHVLPQKAFAFRAETALRRWLVCRSVRSAGCLMTPSAAMLQDLRRFVRTDGRRAVVNPYGVPRARIARPSRATSKSPEPLRLLWVSHYADHKNLGTLLLAIEHLRRSGDLSFQLLLTLDLNLRDGQHTPLPRGEQELLRKLVDVVRPVGIVSYERAWELYTEADLFVFPSLCESFGHPLVEAMASGLPIVASDTAVHREICGDAAAYFPVLDWHALAQLLLRLLREASTRRDLAARARKRAVQFCWEDHVSRLLAMLRDLAGTPANRRVNSTWQSEVPA